MKRKTALFLDEGCDQYTRRLAADCPRCRQAARFDVKPGPAPAGSARTGKPI